MAVLPAGEGTEILRQGLAGQRTSGQHGDGVFVGKHLLLAPFDRHQWMLIECFGQGCAVAAPIHRQGASSGHGMGISRANDQRAEAPEFLLEQTCGPIAAEGPEAVAADQLCKFAAVMRR